MVEATKETEVEQKTEVAAETKTAEEKTAAEKTSADEKVVESDAAAEKLGKDFDKKADEGEEHTAETDEDKEAKEAKAKTEAEEAKAKEKTKADEESGKKDPDKEVDESLLERAVRAGLSLERARKYSSKEDLEHTLELLEESQKSQTKSEQTPEEQETEKKAKEEAEAKVKDDEAPYDCGLDPALYDEDLIKGLNELGTMLKKRVVALESGHSKHAKAFVSDNITKHTAWLDSRFNRMSDDDLKEVYGKGDFDDIEEGGEQFKARAALDVEISKIATDLRKAKKTVPSRNKLFDMAIEALHKGKSTKKVDAKTKAKLAARAKEAVGGGSSKVSAETAEAKALQTNKDFDSKIDEDED